MQVSLFTRCIVDRLGVFGAGVTAPQFIRADDGLTYVVKDEVPNQPLTVRASEFLWLSLAKAIGLPAPVAEVINDENGTPLVGTRREPISSPDALAAFLTGHVNHGGVHLSRIYAFDLFSANWDRHPGNYLVLDDGAGLLAAFAIDFSHVKVHPGLVDPARDPLVSLPNATRQFFPVVVAPYGPDVGAAISIADRIDALPVTAVDMILTAMPDAWLSPAEKADVLNWWKGPSRSTRVATLRQGLQNGTLI
ncbi:hypothetical protein [Bradyrhizobium japonicum]|uniref:hypothetical protein n=1 Tax=Bradyrhizobium japonicum TaxID=375 RepID=UPI000577BCBB|nr:hypothetical protein [Bradyrhizobium japonicum]